VEIKSDDLDQKRELSTFRQTVEIKSETKYLFGCCCCSLTMMMKVRSETRSV
jgi:hypothetical protein